ncbi:MAG TPA: S41 family peptidase [Anaerolineae bacterium]|nr:S41 family peptidase [Anaerolineae bacterium]
MKKYLQFFFIGLFLLIIFGATFMGGAFFGRDFLAAKKNNYSFNSNLELNELFIPVFEAWDIVHEQYVDQPVDDIEMMHGAISGMLESLGDPHTSYMDPDEYQQQNAPLQGEYTGIGAWVDTSGKFLIIISPMPNSPAEEAGIKPGDIVINIDGEDMTGVDPTLILRRILGPADTKVILTIVREDENIPIDIEITRAVIEVPAIEYHILDNNIAYLRLFQYSTNVDEKVKNALEEMLINDPIGLIFDLRNNSGGFLDSAINITSLFIDEGTIMIEEWGDGTQEIYKAQGDAIEKSIPLIVLVNGGTASASEITAGAIQDHERGILIGSVTFGKGLIQNWTILEGDNGAVRVSVARWLTPNGRQIQGDGLVPDIVVEITEEDYEAGIDPQLDKAIEWVLNR